MNSSSILQLPEKDDVCIGENHWKLVFVNKRSGLSCIHEFERCGGRVFNPIYYPPKETDTYSIQQTKSYGIEMVNSLYGNPLANTTRKPVSISCVSWKLGRMIAAVAFPDSSVHFYDLEAQKWTPTVLQSIQMFGIQSLCWKGDSSHTLAVSCVNGVFIWNIEKEENESRCHYHQVLNTPNAIRAEFSPNGHFLCVFHRDSSVIQVLDTLTYSHLTSLGSIHCLPMKILFSPDSAILVVENSDNTISIYNTLTWKKETWKMHTQAMILDVAFSSNSEFLYLLCAVDQSSVVYTLQISHNLNILYTTMTENILMLPGEQEGLPRATRLCVDHRGKRLVCSHGDSNILSLYRIDNSCQMYLIGLITNPITGNAVQEMSFVDSDLRGSILNVMWKSGHLLCYHLLYWIVF